MTAILELRDVSVRFGGLLAVNAISLTLEAGSVTGVIGPNGAGKSTLFNVITGLYRPSAGAVYFQNRSLERVPVDAIARGGIARTFQNIRLFAFMTVRDNVMVGRHGRMRSSLFDSMLHTPRHRREEREAKVEADELLAFTGLAPQADRQAHGLSYGDQRRLEIARALAAGPRLLLLDEPAAGMNPSEKSGLGELIGRIAARGISVLLIEHDMQLVAAVCSRVHVLDHGECIASGTPAEVRADARVVEAYLGAPEPTGPADGPAIESGLV